MNNVKCYGVVDVPYNFTDEKGNPRSGATRKAFLIEFNSDGSVNSAYCAKCVPDFECSQLKTLSSPDYDKYGRLTRLSPVK